MTHQANPPSEAQQLADARTASQVAQVRIRELEAQVDALRGERDGLRAALDRYISADDCEYGDGPPCPGDSGVPQCMYCQACAARAQTEG